MQIRPLFNKYQKYLLSFANTKFGRNYLQFKGNKLPNCPILKVTPDSIHFKLDKKNVRYIGYSKSPYLKKFRLALEGLEIASGVLGKIRKPEFVIPHFAGLNHVAWLPLVMRASKTLYPDANPETTSCDGSSFYTASPRQNWATIRGQASGTTTTAEGTDGIVRLFYLADGWQYLNRCFYLFDTSSIKAGATVNSGIFSVYLKNTRENYTDSWALVSSSPATNTDIVDADFNQTGTTLFATALSQNSIDDSSYVQENLTLNSAGLEAIVVDGITKFGARLEADRANSEPSLSGGQGAVVFSLLADNGSNMPELVVDYEPAPLGGGSPMIFGGGLCLG